MVQSFINSNTVLPGVGSVPGGKEKNDKGHSKGLLERTKQEVPATEGRGS